MSSDSWEVGQITAVTVAAGLLFVYMLLVWAGIGVRKCYTKRRSSGVKHSGLYSPLLHLDEVEGNSPRVYKVKPVKGLWARQVVGGLEVIYHVVVASWIFTKQESPRNEGPWAEAGAAHCVHALAFLLCLLAEEHHHRSQASTRGPVVLLLFYLASLGADLYIATVACQQVPVEQAIRLGAVWNVLPQVLLTLLGLHGVVCPPVPYEYEHPPTAEMTASLPSYALFFWFWPVIAKGLRKRLDADDLPNLPEDDLSVKVWDVYRPLVQPLERTALAVQEQRKRSAEESPRSDVASQQAVEGQGEGEGREPLLTPTDRQAGEEKKPEEPKRRGWRLMGTLFRLGSWDMVATAVFQLIGALSVFAAPLALKEVVAFITDYSVGQAVPMSILFCTALLFLGPATQAIADGLNFFIGRRLILRYRSALISLIFRKALRLDMSCSSYSVGELTNLCSVDANSVEAVGYFHFLWSTLLQILVCIYLIFNVLGVSALAGLLFMILSLPITALATKNILKFQTVMMTKKDERMSIVTEVLQGIRIIKMFAWEKDFKARIEEARANEVSYLRRFILMRIIVICSWDATPTLVSLFTFIFHALILKRPLTASAGFAALALFDLLRFPLVVLPDMVNYLIKALVSFGRIESFLEREEISPRPLLGASTSPLLLAPSPYLSSSGKSATPLHTPVSGSEANPPPLPPLHLGGIRLRDASFRWGSAQGSGPLTLSHLNLSVEPGSLVCVYGPTGCGKTSLLMAMLGEIHRLSGVAAVNGRVAYVAQKSWIRNMTLRDNILFGKRYDVDHYREAVEACALTRDLEILEGGDLTEIGEKGVNLSGGQQQRVNLARATYQTLHGAADVIIMDDVLSAVDAHVGEHIFEHCICGAMIGKTRVLVTHQVALTLPKADYVVIMGRGGEIVEQGSRAELQDRAPALLRKYGVLDGDEEGKEEDDDAQAGPGEASGGHGDKKGKGGEEGGVQREGTQLIKEEEREEGRLKFRVYLAYFRAMGGFLVVSLLMGMYAAVEGLRYEQTRLLGTWVNRITAGHDVTTSGLPYIYVSAGVTALILLRALTGAWASLRASLLIHKDMVARVIRAPTGWFDQTPVGRVQNRFSSDIETIDKNLMDSLTSFVECLLNAVAVAVVVSARMPPLLAGMLPILGLAFWVGHCYLKSSRELKRLESTTRSPIYSHFSETVVGVSTVRAYGVQSQFIRESEQRVDLYGQVNFYLWAANRWLGVRLQLLGAAASGMVGVYILVSLPSGVISSTTAGLTLLYANTFSSSMNWLIRNQAELEMNMNSMERTEEYCEVPQEAPEVVEDYRPPDNWPSRGEMMVTGLTVRYNSSANPVITDMTFYVPPGTRVGVVGRTGAGKSSLLAALYRLVEPEAGHVVIDGLNTRKLGLSDLRARLAVVPQDPTLFRGSVRANMDPFSEFGDKAIWDALRRAHLADALQRKAGGTGQGQAVLEMQVTENGGNMSVGERQLLCMARALLRKRAVLVMDEATANVDVETDALIQETLRHEFSGCSVLTVAHRLATVVFYDRVLVMDQGRIIEYDTPLKLLQRSDGLFYSMCERTGDLDRLLLMAREAAAQQASHTASPGR